jgi:hypothetical protein
MMIDLDPELEAALAERARREGIAPEALVLKALRERFLRPTAPRLSHEEFERRIRAMGRDCGVSLPNSALSSDELYD